MAPKQKDKTGLVKMFNELLKATGLTILVQTVDEVLSVCQRTSVFVAAFEVLAGRKMLNIEKKPSTEAQRAANIDAVVKELSSNVFHLEMSYISGERVVEGNLSDIHHLVEIMASLCSAASRLDEKQAEDIGSGQPSRHQDGQATSDAVPPNKEPSREGNSASGPPMSAAAAKAWLPKRAALSKPTPASHLPTSGKAQAKAGQPSRAASSAARKKVPPPSKPRATNSGPAPVTASSMASQKPGAAGPKVAAAGNAAAGRGASSTSLGPSSKGGPLREDPECAPSAVPVAAGSSSRLSAPPGDAFPGGPEGWVAAGDPARPSLQRGGETGRSTSEDSEQEEGGGHSGGHHEESRDTAAEADEGPDTPPGAGRRANDAKLRERLRWNWKAPAGNGGRSLTALLGGRHAPWAPSSADLVQRAYGDHPARPPASPCKLDAAETAALATNYEVIASKENLQCLTKNDPKSMCFRMRREEAQVREQQRRAALNRELWLKQAVARHRQVAMAEETRSYLSSRGRRYEDKVDRIRLDRFAEGKAAQATARRLRRQAAQEEVFSQAFQQAVQAEKASVLASRRPATPAGLLPPGVPPRVADLVQRDERYRKHCERLEAELVADLEQRLLAEERQADAEREARRFVRASLEELHLQQLEKAAAKEDADLQRSVYHEDHRAALTAALQRLIHPAS